MAAKVSKGSIILEILIILMALLLIAVILVPNKIWEEEDQVAHACRANMNSLFEAELFYNRSEGNYTDSLSNLLTFIQGDSGLHQRQSIVSLTRSFVKLINNVLGIPSIEQISNISLAAFEITGDLAGNDRYFRKYPGLSTTSEQIMREMMQLDSSSILPNFSRTKLFVDSLRSLRERVSDYPLQNGILHAINYVDSINLYYGRIEREQLSDFWKEEYQKVSDFINNILETDIKKVSSVSDRLKKFIDRIDKSINAIQTVDPQLEKEKMGAEKQNLIELHQKFLSPDFFMLTKRYGMNSLNETDSLLINLSHDNFYCPENNQPYLIDTTLGKQLVVECPNLLDIFHDKFVNDVQPLANLQLFNHINQIDTVLANTKSVLENNRAVFRRSTDLLLKMKEVVAEIDQFSNVFFYRYVHQLSGFLNLLKEETKLSELKPAIEDILNPMDTLAVRIDTGNLSDLIKKLEEISADLEHLDTTVAKLRLPSRLAKTYVPGKEAFQLTFDIVDKMKSGFSDDAADALLLASDALEEDLLNALEGESETVNIIFKKEHINHGYIKGGDKSWEQK